MWVSQTNLNTSLRPLIHLCPFVASFGSTLTRSKQPKSDIWGHFCLLSNWFGSQLIWVENSIDLVWNQLTYLNILKEKGTKHVLLTVAAMEHWDVVTSPWTVIRPWPPMVVVGRRPGKSAAPNHALLEKGRCCSQGTNMKWVAWNSWSLRSLRSILIYFRGLGSPNVHLWWVNNPPLIALK